MPPDIIPTTSGAPAYGYQVPEWYTQAASTKLAASNAANDAWFARPELAGVSFSGKPTINWRPTAPPPFATWGDDVSRAYAHGAAIAQGLFEARARGYPMENANQWSDWTSFGPGGEGFAEKKAPALGYSYIWDTGTAEPNMSPALYERSMLSPYFVPGTGMTGAWDRALGMPEYQGSPVDIGGIQYRPGSDGHWRQNVFDAAIEAVSGSLTGAHDQAAADVRQALARKGQLDSMAEKFAMEAIRGDAQEYNLDSFGNDAVRFFDNLVDQDLSWFDNELNTVWSQVGSGRAVPWYEPPRVPPGTVSIGASLQDRMSGINGDWFQPLVDRSTGNYNEAMEYAQGLSPDLSNIFGLAMQAANRGAGDARAAIGVGQPTAYFGDLQRVGGWQEQLPNQEFANQFSEDNARGYGGATT